MDKLKNIAPVRVLMANPIFLRIVEAASKRPRHAVLRGGYLAVLLMITMFSILVGMASSMNELSLMASRMFVVISFGQLAMAAISAPIFTAGAITQEKDNQTFRILLSTPLSNSQIVYGMLLSRLFFVVALVLSGLPVFLITQFFGGVTGSSILMSFAIAISTAVFTGSLAISLAVFTSGTSRTVFNFYVCYGLYLIAVWLIGVSPLAALHVPGATTSQLTALHPFLSLSAALRISTAPDPALLSGAGWLKRQWLCYPQYFYIAWTLAVSLVLPAMSALLLRWRQANMRRSSGRSLWSLFRPGRTTQQSRVVWHNPIAWREAATRCSTGGGGLVKWLFFLTSAAMALSMLWMYHNSMLSTAAYRDTLAMLLTMEFVLILLIVCWFASSAVNREMEDGTLDLLLMSPITSREYIGGKLRGLVGLSTILLVMPFAAALLQACYDLATGPVTEVVGYHGRSMEVPIMPIEGCIHIACMMPAFCAMAALIGLSCSLKNSHLFKSIAKTLGTLAAVIGCLFAFVGVTTSLEGVISVVAVVSNPMTLAFGLISPHDVLDNNLELAGSMATFRFSAIACTLIVSGIYFISVMVLRRQLEVTFDMTIRNRSKN